MNNFNKYKCFVFAGNLGEAQSLETILSACLHMEKYKDFRMVLIGTGSRLGWVKEQIKFRNISNLIIAGPFDLANMVSIYQITTGLILTLSAKSHFSKTIPSKLQTYLASGKPIIGAVSGEAGKIIIKSKSGLVCNSEDDLGLAELIIKVMKKSDEERSAMGMNGREYFIQNYDLNSKIFELEKIFEKVRRHIV